MTKHTQKAFTLALIHAIYFNAVLVLVKELVPQFKLFLRRVCMHHWLGHGLLLLMFFVLAGLLYNYADISIKKPHKVPRQILTSIIVTGIGISIFYLNNVH